MSVKTPEELAALRAAGRVVADALQAMRVAVRPGVTTGELDAVAGRVFRRAGARSGPHVEPIISAGSGAVRATSDGWTLRTSDGARSAHVEHTIVVRDGAALVLTA